MCILGPSRRSEANQIFRRYHAGVAALSKFILLMSTPFVLFFWYAPLWQKFISNNNNNFVYVILKFNFFCLLRPSVAKYLFTDINNYYVFNFEI